MNVYSLKPIHIRSRLLRYSLAVVSCLVFVTLKLQFSELIAVNSPFLLAELFVIFSAYFLGRGPALLTTILNALFVDYFFIFPYYSIDIFSVTHLLQNIFFILQSVLVIIFIHRQKLTQWQLFDMNLHLDELVKKRTQSLQESSHQLEASNKELGRSNRELEEFAHIASHDLQEPLRKIQSFGNLLKEEYHDVLGGEGKMYLDRMLDATQRMRTLINDLLNYSRVTTRALPFKNVHLSVVLQEVLSDLETSIKEHQAQITFSSLPIIKADPLQIRQLFQNLISNSIKFSKPNTPPLIEVKHKIKDETITITFSDNGIGMDPQYTYKIFTIFERLHGKNEYEGTGIGLAVVKKIVDRHHGSIQVSSKPNKGTVFTIQLPINQNEVKHP